VYPDPLGPALDPDNYFKDYYSNAFHAVFDNSDNLYAIDSNRQRVLIYKKPFSSCGTKQGDLNMDGFVDIFDLSTLLTRWGSTDNQADLNDDGVVSIFDLSILLSNWGI
jgi:hypothetical protein